MSNFVKIKNKINSFNKSLSIDGDKSLSIRWALLSSQSLKKCRSSNLLLSEDVHSSLNCLQKLGVKIKISKKFCEIIGLGLNGFRYKNNTILDAGNSGTLGRLILGLLVHSKKKVKLKGDKSLSKRDFQRVASPLSKFGASFRLTNNCNLPLTVKGSEKLKPIRFFENKGSAQCKSSIIFGGMKTNGKTVIKAKKSRDHTELLFKHLKLPIKIKKKKNLEIIEISKVNKIKPLNYKIPSDISSAAFFIALTVLSGGSKIIIKNINVNPTRIGIIKILKKMGIKISFLNKKIYKGEPIADILVLSPRIIKSLNCPSEFNSGAIDEFLVIFLIAAKAKGVSHFKKLEELNKKESPRLIWGSKLLKMMGIKAIVTKDSIKIFGNPQLKIKKKIVISKYLKDHRVFMTSVIAALTFGGNWTIHDKDSIKTSFPKFLKLIKKQKK